MTRLYRLSNNSLIQVAGGKLANENMIHNWIAERPELLGLDLLIVGREVVAPDRGRIDLLGIDDEGNLAILELKRDRTPRDVIAQALDYASWVTTLSTREVHEIALKHLKRDLDVAFRERFDTALPETLNESHTIVIIASRFDSSSQRIVRYLFERYDIAINTAFFSVFDDDGRTLLATDWLLDQDEVAERSEIKAKGPWSGLWYVNVDDGAHRSWDDMQRYGFICAGGGEKYSNQLKRLHPGDSIVAYQKGAGYVGYGIVTSTPVIVTDFKTESGPLLEQELLQSDIARTGEDVSRAEYVVGVDWKKTVPIAEAKRFEPGMFANQNIVCKLRDPKTVEFVRGQFGNPIGIDAMSFKARKGEPIKCKNGHEVGAFALDVPNDRTIVADDLEFSTKAGVSMATFEWRCPQCGEVFATIFEGDRNYAVHRGSSWITWSNVG